MGAGTGIEQCRSDGVSLTTNGKAALMVTSTNYHLPLETNIL